MKKIAASVISSIIIILILILGVIIYRSVFLQTKPGKVTTITKSSLEKVIEISELSTVENTYNAVVPVYEEDSRKIKYYVSYQGIVKAGIDFDKIEIAVDEENKTITITIPDSEIVDCYVEPGKLQYIFLDNSYNIDITSAEAFQMSEKNLSKRAREEKSLLSLAKENAGVAIEALIRPWVEQIDDEYVVEIE